MAHTISNAKVVYVPVEARDEEGKKLFVRTGIRIDLGDGQWWFYSFRFDTFTRHRPGLLDSRSWTPQRLPERVDKFSGRPDLIKRLGHCASLIEAIETGMALALEAEADRRRQ